MSELRSAADLDRDPQDADEPAAAAPPKKTAPRERKKKQQEEALQHNLDWQNVLETLSGRRLVAYVLHDLCAHREPVFHPSNSVMCNIAGRRQVGIRIEKEIRDISFDLWTAVDRELEELRAKPNTAKSS